jgi:hypothetical protein
LDGKIIDVYVGDPDGGFEIGLILDPVSAGQFLEYSGIGVGDLGHIPGGYNHDEFSGLVSDGILDGRPEGVPTFQLVKFDPYMVAQQL